MTIKKTDNHLIILHRVVGLDPLVHILGDMSVETATMLESHHLSDEMDKASYGFQSPIEALMEDRTNQSWLIRSYKAAEAHIPKIATNFGKLTEYGKSLTSAAAMVMDKLYNADTSYAKPETLDNPDDWFIQARIPLRAFRMLKMMDQLIESSKLLFEANGPQHVDWDTVVKNVLKDISSDKEGRPLPTGKLFDDASTLLVGLSPYQEDVNAYEPQKLDTITIPLTGFDLVDSTVRPTTVVPTGLLGARGRRDLKQLVLLNLVDLRIIRHGGRGRPKQAMIVSPIGQKLVRHETLFHIT